MEIEMKKKNYKIILGILLLFALVVAVFLVKQRQDTRRGATSLAGFIRLSLDENSTTKEITVGQEFTVPIVANITGASGVDSVVAYFCYDPTKIELKDTSTLENSFNVSSPTSYVGGSVKVSESTNKCVKVTFVSVVQNTKLNSSVATINFKTVASSGTGTITIDKSNSSLGVAGDDTVEISSVGSLSYSIEGCTDGAVQCYSSTNYQTCNSGVWGASTSCGSGKYCLSGVCTTSTSVSTIGVKLAFAGVKSGSCATNWPVILKVVDSTGDNVLDNVFSGVPTQTTSTNSNGEIIYDFSVSITGVPSGGASGLAIFLTGPKHISLKYGSNNQSAWYSSLVGGLSITTGANNYDFSNFSLLAGDVNKDGKIDGRDYSYIKEKASVLTNGSAGTSVDGDINGDCQVNSGDIALIKKSLKEVNGQTY